LKRCDLRVFLILRRLAARVENLGSRMSDPTTATKEEGGKILVVLTFSVATNFTALKTISFLKKYRKKSDPIHKQL